MAGDNDKVSWGHFGHMFTFDALIKTKQSSDFVLQMPEFHVNLTLKVCPGEGDYYYGKVVCEPNRIVYCKNHFLVRLGYKKEKIEDKWSCLKGFQIGEEIKVVPFKKNQRIEILCQVFSLLGKNKIVVNNDDKGKCSRGIDHGKLLESGLYADFTIKADGQAFKCHKYMLAARSTVFESMFASNMKESTENEERVSICRDLILKLGYFGLCLF